MLMEPVNAPARYRFRWFFRILWDPHVLSSAKPMVIFRKEVSLTSEGASTTYTVNLARAKLPVNIGNFTCSSQVKRPHTQFTCVTCSLPVKTGNYTCFYAASTSHRIHAVALNKASKLQVTSPAWCRLTYLQFAGEFTRGVIADCLQLQVILCRIAVFFACDCAGIFSCLCSFFACVWRVFSPAIVVFLPVSCMCFCLQKQAILHASRGKYAWVPYVKLPVKCPWYSGKFTCACILREVLAASTQVNLPVFTGKLHVTQVNCVWDRFTCELQVKLPAFAGNFARTSFTV